MRREAGFQAETVADATDGPVVGQTDEILSLYFLQGEGRMLCVAGGSGNCQKEALFQQDACVLRERFPRKNGGNAEVLFFCIHFLMKTEMDLRMECLVFNNAVGDQAGGSQKI